MGEAGSVLDQVEGVPLLLPARHDGRGSARKGAGRLEREEGTSQTKEGEETHQVGNGSNRRCDTRATPIRLKPLTGDRKKRGKGRTLFGKKGRAICK